MDGMRQETDSLGTVNVPQDRLWGAQTQRSFLNFRIGNHRMPKEMISALLAIKEAAAVSNHKLGTLDEEKKDLIIQAIQSLTNSDLTTEFPLSVWQTGSGTQTNMNVNEVVSNRANEIAGQPRGTKSPIHPNDHVNKSQSSNDAFPTAMHIACANAITTSLLPALSIFHAALNEKAKAFHHIIKVGRTHLMDAVPIRLGQEFSGYAAQIEHSIHAIYAVLPRVFQLAIGGTAVGTGINCPEGFKEEVCEYLSNKLNIPFRPADNAFEGIASHDTAVELSGTIKRGACALFKIANDIRLMASGPRCGIAELTLPENEPGSSIMPGKINPTQCEAATQVVCQIIGNDTAISMAASQGQFDLNAFKPVIAKNCLESIHLLADASTSLTEKCLNNLQANEDRIRTWLEQSLMLATALSKEIGYDKASKIALLAVRDNLTLKEAALMSGVPEDLFMKATDPTKMV